MTRVPVTAVILTRDEELNLPRCLASIEDLADEIFVVDSGSTDATVRIAREHGAMVAEHEFRGHSRQWQWALTQLPIRNAWVLGLDADQSLTTELADEIRALFAGGTHGGSIAGYYVARRNIFRGRWIRWGGYYPKYLLKLFRRADIRFEAADLLDHHFRVAGSTAKLRHDIIEENRKEESIDFWVQKHLQYAELLAREELQRSAGGTARLVRAAPLGDPDERAEWQKQTWSRLPRFVRPAAYFVWRYFVRLGFLDGKQGFTFHFLHAFWFRLIADLKLEEVRSRARTRD
ncbi:MAG: glycosyltransferase family 2 protein [Gemmatimonadota bacterium]